MAGQALVAELIAAKSSRDQRVRITFSTQALRETLTFPLQFASIFSCIRLRNRAKGMW
jgi:hypothetical protein